ncbi:uncharacterized protein N7496_009575 [Penicillium cataractarum]|uniref:Multicopper oxidase n=1 Tax=Penicillium cataractarum TaxID=2100454 RepID=A0A9W9RPB5_9EURO|nr:uncharacterized protein N7496_009575 [Penicillium cataractarum]KAJ5363862.1 hypothetical protein N7496_009575 [Penicillium cataractarum]
MTLKTGSVGNLDSTLTLTSTSLGQTRDLHVGQRPVSGATLVADWGDTIVVNVKNSMQYNGTGLHWHGIRQLGTVEQDGVPGITECPLATNDSRTYKFKATQYGTSWYHSHFNAQYGNGLLGGIHINGPSTANYDIDLGHFFVSDWYYDTAEQDALRTAAAFLGAPAVGNADTVLVNGTNKSPDNSTGSWSTTTIIPGKTYRLRVVNSGVDNQIRISLDNHPLTIIANDLVPIEPITVDTLLKGTKPSDPTSSAYPDPGDCNEPSPLRPWIHQTVPNNTFVDNVDSLILAFTGVTFPGVNGTGISWTFNNTGILVDWSDPTLKYVVEHDNNFNKNMSVIKLPGYNEWAFWVIQAKDGANTVSPIPHPMHLHGHDFFIIGQKENAIFDNEADFQSLNFTRPPRRDVALLPN